TQLIGGNALVPLLLTPIWQVTSFPNQYIGIWLALAIGLHMYWASRLVSLFATDERLVILGSVMLTLSPVLFYRMGWMLHGTLVCQWILLWGLTLYFENQLRAQRWLLLLIVAMLSNLYIFVMVLAVVGGAFLRELLAHKSKSIQRTWRTFANIGGATIAIAWVFGLLRSGESFKGDGTFRSNVLAFFNPDFGIDEFSSLWTSFPYFRNRTLLWESGEGFAYLGLGVLLSLALVVVQWRRFVKQWRAWLPLVIVALLLFGVAISNVAALSRREFSYWWPAPLLEFREVFRAAPRFSWLLYYTLMFAGVGAIVTMRQISNTRRIVILACLVIVQIIDIAPGLSTSRRELLQPDQQPNLMLSNEWSNFAQEQKRIVFAPTFDISIEATDRATSEWQDSPIWFDVVWWASENGLTTNFAATARPATEAVTRENQRLSDEFSSGNLRSNSLYVFRTPESRTKLVTSLRSGCKAQTASRVAVVVCD
ncbi:MAG: DUF6311 domain-containing protein, partial [Actinomycetota bacterium]